VAALSRKGLARLFRARLAQPGFIASPTHAALTPNTFVGQKIPPFRIEDGTRAVPSTSFIVQGAFKPFAIRDGLLITGQQQFSGMAAARLMIEALGV